MFNENRSELLALPAPDPSLYVDGAVEAEITTPDHIQNIQENNEEKKIIYGRDLNSSDLLLLGVNKELKKIMTDEYGIGSEFSWEYPTSFSTTSRKVIINDGTHSYFIKEKPKYCCKPYNLSLAAEFQKFLSEKTDFVPAIIHTSSENPYLKVGETIFFTTEYKSGRMFNASMQDVENAGIALGKIHLASREFVFSDPHNIHASEDALEFINIADKLNGAENDKNREVTIKSLRDIVDQYKDQVDDNVEYIVNHGDYAPFNLVYDHSGNTVAVNDFDNVNFRPRTRDVAGAILSFCDGLSYAGSTSTLRKPIATTLNVDKTKEFIKGYITNSYAFTDKEKLNLIGETMIRWTKIMALGIMRGDFNYIDVQNALSFKKYIEESLPELL